MVEKEERKPDRQVVVIGAGPSGLTAAYELSRQGVSTIVIEKEHLVGGLARTEEFRGFLFDMGGHRFFTKNKKVNWFWRDILKDDFLRRPRLSRIYYKNKFFNYPPVPSNVLKGLGLLESTTVVLSYLLWQVKPYPREETFEQWVTNRFGRRLFKIFFETYTEKVWGIRCSELRAEWAAQRIKGLTLRTALLSVVRKPKTKIKTLVHEFDYPRLGPGMMWNTVKDRIEQFGGSVLMQHDVVEIRRSGNRIDSIVVPCNGKLESIQGTDFISSMPITEFVKNLRPSPPPGVLRAAEELKYRDFLTVCLIVNSRDLFPDNWIYVHDPNVKVGRIQNYKNWSAEMVPDPSKSSLGLEYFCNEGDDLWTMPDSELIELGRCEVDQIGLAHYADIESGCVFRVPKAYPVYDATYRGHLDTIRDFVDGLENFQTIGRNGLHRYNNQDHAMLTGMLAVRNLLLAEANDLWSVNTEQEYQEEVEITEEEVITKVQEELQHAFLKLDPVAFGCSMGAVSGLILFLATMVPVIRGGPVVGPHIGLLTQFLPGYTVTLEGSFIGLIYAMSIGFIGGWFVAFLRNCSVRLYMGLVYRRAERDVLKSQDEYL